MILDMRPGDIILSRAQGSATNVLIPGYFKHAALYLGNSQIIEAIDPCVRSISLWYFVADKSEIAVVRPKGDLDYRGALQEALKLEGVPYDYEFIIKHDNKMMYCGEYCYWPYLVANPDWDFTLRMVWGEPTAVPDDFYRAKKHFELVGEYR